MLSCVAGHDCSIRLWNLDSKTCVQEITSHRKKFDESIHDVAFHPSKPFIASAGADALAKVFAWCTVTLRDCLCVNECLWCGTQFVCGTQSRGGALWSLYSCSCTAETPLCHRDITTCRALVISLTRVIVIMHKLLFSAMTTSVFDHLQNPWYLYLKVCNWLLVSWSLTKLWHALLLWSCHATVFTLHLIYCWYACQLVFLDVLFVDGLLLLLIWSALSDTHSYIMLCLIYLCHCHTVFNGTGTFQKVVQLKSSAAPRGGIWEGVSPPQLTTESVGSRAPRPPTHFGIF